jgi:predicted DNA-binding transcriptional regulator AlpA
MRQPSNQEMSQDADFPADVRIIPHARRFVKSEIQDRLRG